MKAVQIKLKNANDIERFVAITQRFDFEIFLRHDNFKVDAKSILGVFALAPQGVLNMEIYAKDCGELIESISEFVT